MLFVRRDWSSLTNEKFGHQIRGLDVQHHCQNPQSYSDYSASCFGYGQQKRTGLNTFVPSSHSMTLLRWYHTPPAYVELYLGEILNVHAKNVSIPGPK